MILAQRIQGRQMSRIQPKPAEAYPWYLRLLFFFQRRKYGAALEPSLIWGRSPPLYLAFSHFRRALDRPNSPLPKELRALVAARVSQIYQSRFCIDINSWLAVKGGVEERKLLALASAQRSPLFSAKERQALRYAEVLTSAGVVSDALFADVKAHFSDDEIVELTALICFQGLSSKFNSALDIASQGFIQPSKDSAEFVEGAAYAEPGTCPREIV